MDIEKTCQIDTYFTASILADPSLSNTEQSFWVLGGRATVVLYSAMCRVSLEKGVPCSHTKNISTGKFIWQSSTFG